MGPHRKENDPYAVDTPKEHSCDETDGGGDKQRRPLAVVTPALQEGRNEDRKGEAGVSDRDLVVKREGECCRDGSGGDRRGKNRQRCSDVRSEHPLPEVKGRSDREHEDRNEVENEPEGVASGGVIHSAADKSYPENREAADEQGVALPLKSCLPTKDQEHNEEDAVTHGIPRFHGKA